MKRIIRYAFALAAAVAVLVGVVPYFVPWTPLNCRQIDVDIATGRACASRYLAYYKISEQITETALSRALPRAEVEGTPPQWRPVSTFSPGYHHSPHYHFHGASNQIRLLDMIWERSEVPESIRLRTARHVLSLWQLGGSYWLADRYIDNLMDLMDPDKRGQTLHTLERMELPWQDLDEGNVVTRTFSRLDGHLIERMRGYRDDRGQFVQHGIWEAWHPDGKREIYGHFEHGEHHGRRFEWDSGGQLIGIAAYLHGELAEYVAMEDLKGHPDYEAARRLAEVPVTSP